MRDQQMNRRTLLGWLASLPIAAHLHALSPKPKSTPLSTEDDAFLDDLERRGCRFFFEQASDTNGQVLDRAAADNTSGSRDPRTMASVAATGFGLAALCVADKRGYLPHDQVLERVRLTLRAHRDKLQTMHGFFLHFNHVDTFAPVKGSEVSPIDTSLLLCGVLTARAYFAEDAEIHQLATAIYERVDWPWMLNGGQAFAMGWRDGGFLSGRWNHYCELMMMYLLALGSRTHPIEPACWDAFTRPGMEFDGYSYISAKDPLFVHQFSHAFFDFRGKRDKYANYFENSITATRAHQSWCLSLGYPYSREYWGITASDSPRGYTAWGGPPRLGDAGDGCVVPCAAAGSLAFLPTECLLTLRAQKDKYGAKAYGRYGFCDAFNGPGGWYDRDVLGIDAGISVLMAENLRTGFVWQTFARNPEVAVAFAKAGFRKT